MPRRVRSKTAPAAARPMVAIPDEVDLWPEADPRLTREYMRANRRDFRDQCLKIRTKLSKVVPFRDNFTQRLIDGVIAEERAVGRRPQLIVLKSRQVGVSTKVQAIGFEDTFLGDHREAFIITDKTEHSKLMIQMNRRFLRNLPPSLRPQQKDMRLENVHGLQFPWDSRIQVETEGDAHSMTANILHLSEFAYFKRPDDTMKEAMPAVPDDPSSLVVIESTANGQGNEFYDLFTRAMEAEVAKRKFPWRAVFIAWWQHEEYWMQPDFTPAQATLRERELFRRFGVNMRQLAWRRNTIDSIFKGDEDEFETRFPTTWQEAFKRSGRPVFEPEQMDHILDLVPPRKNEGSVWVNSVPAEVEWDATNKVPRIVPQSGGRLRVFREFNERHEYFLGADPSEGDRRSDPSPLEVLDVTGDWTLDAMVDGVLVPGKRGHFEQVAEWWGRTPPDVLADYAMWIGQIYGNALIVGEANGLGIAFNNRLVACGYPAVYMRQTHEEDVSGAITLKPGMMSTNKSKHAAIVTLRAALRASFYAVEAGKAPTLLIHSPILLGEMGTAVYFRREQTQMGHAGLQTQVTKPSNKAIDTLWAFAWALYVHRGGDANALLPLEPKVLVSAQAQTLLALERHGRDAADQVAMDLSGMTGDDLMAVVDARAKRRGRIKEGLPPWLAVR